MHEFVFKVEVDREPRPVSGPRSIILSDGMRAVNLQTGTDESNARRAAAQFIQSLQPTAASTGVSDVR